MKSVFALLLLFAVSFLAVVGQGRGEFLVFSEVSCCVEKTCGCPPGGACSAGAEIFQGPTFTRGCGCGLPGELWVVIEGPGPCSVDLEGVSLEVLALSVVDSAWGQPGSLPREVESPPPRA